MVKSKLSTTMLTKSSGFTKFHHYDNAKSVLSILSLYLNMHLTLFLPICLHVPFTGALICETEVSLWNSLLN
jgi:hypothetical protein